LGFRKVVIDIAGLSVWPNPTLILVNEEQADSKGKEGEGIGGGVGLK